MVLHPENVQRSDCRIVNTEQPRETGFPQPWPTHFLRAKSRSFPTCQGAKRQLSLVIPCSRNRARMRSASVVSSWRSRLNVSRILLIWDRRVALFEERASSLACLSSSISESTLSSFLIRSRISLCISVSSVSVSCRCSRTTCLSTSDFRSSILVSFTRLFANSSLTLTFLFEPSKLSSDLGDPRGVDWLIINCRQGGLNLFCATTCAVGYAGEFLEFDVFKVAREGFICLLECFHSGATQTFPRCPRCATGGSQRSPQCICTTRLVPRGQCW